MDPTWLVPVSLAFGFLLGVGLVSLMFLAARRGARAHRVASASLPDGVEAVFDALEEAAFVVDASNTVVRASPAALALGLVAHEQVLHPQLDEVVSSVRRTGEPRSEQMELPRSTIGDSTLFFSVRAALIGARYVLVIADDHTESIRLDAMRRDFVANISHELKTPIGAVGLLAEALTAASDDPPQVRKFAKRLTKESRRLGRLTQEIIELSRLQSTDTVTQSAIVPVDELVGRAVDEVRVLADAADVRLVTGGTRGAKVYGDQALLVTSLHNLIGNAIQYSARGTKVGIGVSVVDDVVEIAVSDQGVGIPENELDRVFERFFRTDSARSRKTGGTGLGLSIVKHAVQNHGGDVRVWSQVGRGSTFTIRLPEASETAAALTTKETP